jgi:hypothetical protein
MFDVTLGQPLSHRGYSGHIYALSTSSHPHSLLPHWPCMSPPTWGAWHSVCRFSSLQLKAGARFPFPATTNHVAVLSQFQNEESLSRLFLSTPAGSPVRPSQCLSHRPVFRGRPGSEGLNAGFAMSRGAHQKFDKLCGYAQDLLLALRMFFTLN